MWVKGIEWKWSQRNNTYARHTFPVFLPDSGQRMAECVGGGREGASNKVSYLDRENT